MLLILLIDDVDHLCGDELQDDGIQRLLPPEDQPCNTEDHNIASQRHIESVNSFPDIKEHGNKIQTTGGRSGKETHSNNGSVNDSAEDTDEKGIIGNDVGGNQISEDVGNHDKNQSI